MLCDALRGSSARNPLDRDLSVWFGELSTRSEEFRGHWATHDVRLHNEGETASTVQLVGELELSYNRIEVPAYPGLGITYTAEPSSGAESFRFPCKAARLTQQLAGRCA